MNEEELDIRDGFRWSPGGRRIAFWQFDRSGVGQYTLIYDLGNPRGETVSGIPYPQYGVYLQTMVYPYPRRALPIPPFAWGWLAPAAGPWCG